MAGAFCVLRNPFVPEVIKIFFNFRLKVFKDLYSI